MIFISEEQKNLNALYSKLQDLQEGKRIIEKAMHNNYYNRTVYSNLYEKLNKIKFKIKIVKRQIAKEKLKYEKSRKDICPNVRFQQKNISDAMIFYKGFLFIIELKSHRGKSLPFSCIRDNQFKEMYEASFKKNVFPIVIIFFSDLEECFALKMTDIIELRSKNISKSISLLFVREKGVRIDCRKLQTHYRFEIQDFLENYIKNI